MPSLLGTYVAANYGRMTSQDTYGGITFSNFATRNLAFLKVVSASGVDFTAAPGTDADNTTIQGVSYTDALAQPWQDSNSPFSVAVRTIQQFAEVYFVGSPATSGSNSAFVIAVAIDTANSAAANSNVEVFNTAYPVLATFGALVTSLTNNGITNCTITQLSATGSSIAGSVTYS